MPKYEFGTRQAANDFRDRIPEYLAHDDTRRLKTVALADDTPRDILERARDTALRSGGREDRQASDMAELTDREKENLRRTTGFNWQQHGFEAMRAKAVLQREGVTEWIDYYEPGEPASSSLQKLQQGRTQAMHTGASAGIEGDVRAYVYDDPGNTLTSLTQQEKLIVDQFFEGIWMRVTRARGMRQQEILKTQINQSVTGSIDGDGGKGGLLQRWRD